MSLNLPNREQQIRIKEELNENVNTVMNDLEIIKNWLRQQPHLPDTYDDRRLLNFLRGTKFSIEKCKRKLELYFTKRATVKQFFTDRDICRPELRSLEQFFYGGYLPKLTPDGCRVGLGAILKDAVELPLADIFKLIFMAGDVRVATEEHGVSGDIYILDTKHVLFKQLLKVPLEVVKEFFLCLEAFPTIIKQVHVLNVSSLIVGALTAIRPFIKEKLMKRIHLHTTLDTLFEFVPRDVLPEEYEGTAGKMSDIQNDWIKTLEEHKTWFAEEEKIVADLSKKPKGSENWDLFGVDGSFRKLMVD